jgi:hypothetical protein
VSGWRPTALPKLRQQTARASLTSAERTRAMIEQMRAAGADDAEIERTTGQSAAERKAMWQELRAQAAALAHADCWWVSDAMTHVALDASSDLPDWTPLAAMPDHTGLLAWEPGLPPIPWPGAPQEAWATNALGTPTAPLIIPHAVGWRLHPDDGMLAVDVYTRTALLDERALAESWRTSPLISVVTVLIVPDQPARPPTDQLWTAGLVHCLGATWLLSQQPTVADQHLIEADRADGRALRRAQVPTDVRVVDLRRALTPADPDDEHEHTGRRLKHRHLVRGHWRQQPWGPQHAQRRPTWVAPYLKGPEGAPLVERERVMVWRR